MLSRQLTGNSTVTYLTSNTPTGGTRIIGKSPLCEKKLALARMAYRELQSATLDQLVETAMNADAFYIKKGKIVVVYTDENVPAIKGESVSEHKREARALSVHKWSTMCANKPIAFPVIGTVNLTESNIWFDGYGMISSAYLKRNGIKARTGRKHFSFTIQIGNIQYKGACVIVPEHMMPKVGKSQVHADIVIPNDPKSGLVWEGENVKFFGLNEGYSHVDPRIDPQTFSNMCNWVDFSPSITYMAQAIARKINLGVVGGRGDNLTHEQWGVVNALIEEYRRQELEHLQGVSKGMFHIPAVTGLVGFSRKIESGHIAIDREHGVIWLAQSDFMAYIRAKLGGMDGDDHIIALFAIDLDGSEVVLLYRQPNQLGEVVKMRLQGGTASDYTNIPPVHITGAIPNPRIANLTDKAQQPLNPTAREFAKFIIQLQASSVMTVGRTANAGMAMAMCGLTPPDEVYPDLEALIAGEKEAIDTTRLDKWVVETRVLLAGIPASKIAELPVVLQGKFASSRGILTAELPFEWSPVMKENLEAIQKAKSTITEARPARKGTMGIVEFAKDFSPELKSAGWVAYYAKLIQQSKPNDEKTAKEKFTDYLFERVGKIGMNFIGEVAVELVRSWFTDTQFKNGKWSGATYALAHPMILPIVQALLTSSMDAGDTIMDAVKVGRTKGELPNVLFIEGAIVYGHTGAYCANVYGAPEDGRYDHTQAHNNWQFIQYRGELTKINRASIDKNAPAELGGNGWRVNVKPKTTYAIQEDDGYIPEMPYWA
jgi:hypothetical protein